MGSKVPFGLNVAAFVFLAFVALICVAVVLNTLIETIGKIGTRNVDMANQINKVRLAEINLEQSKLEEGVLPVQICSSAGHTCGAPWHDVREGGDGFGNPISRRVVKPGEKL